MPPSSLPTGLPPVDAQWGGLAPAEAYLLVGRLGAGRAALSLQIARSISDAGRCLLITTRAPETLAEDASRAGFDLAEAHRSGRLRLLRIPAAAELAAQGSDGLAQAYRDLASLVESDPPAAVVVEDFTPLVQFDAFARFEAAFEKLAGSLRAAGSTFVLGLGEPANDASRHLLQSVARHSAGTIRLDVAEDGTRRLVLERPAHLQKPAAWPEAPSYQPEAPSPEASETLEPSAVPSAQGAEPSLQGAEPSLQGAEPSLQGAEPSLQGAEPSPEASPLTLVAAPGPFGPDSFDADPFAPPPSRNREPVQARILPAPPPEASLMEGDDPAAGAEEAIDALLDQGYLVDSGAELLNVPSPTIPAPAASAQPAPPPAVPAPPFGALHAGPFAQEDAPSATQAEPDFARALDAAFGRRVTGEPFTVVAVRMEPSVPEAAHFGLVAEAVCEAPGAEAVCVVDGARARAVALLPGQGPEAASALFEQLQGRLQARLGEGAADALRAVGAVTLPNGEPFTSAADLLDYAYRS